MFVDVKYRYYLLITQCSEVIRLLELQNAIIYLLYGYFEDEIYHYLLFRNRSSFCSLRSTLLNLDIHHFYYLTKSNYHVLTLPLSSRQQPLLLYKTLTTYIYILTYHLLYGKQKTSASSSI